MIADRHEPSARNIQHVIVGKDEPITWR